MSAVVQLLVAVVIAAVVYMLARALTLPYPVALIAALLGLVVGWKAAPALIDRL